MLDVYHGEAGPRQREAFAAAGAGNGLRIEICHQDDTARLDELLGEMEVWWHVLRPINDEILARAPRLRLIHKWGVGVNTIDLVAARRRGVAVANMAGSNAVAVSEATLLLMLSVLRRLPTYHLATVRGRGWLVEPSIGETCGELAGRTVGLVGFGDIAQRLASVLGAMGVKVLHHSLRDDRSGWRPLEEMLAESDVVSLHVPLTGATRMLFDATRLAQMRRGAILINTARGELVDLDALADVIESGHLAGAGLDVFTDEPNDARHRIFSFDNLVSTPHIAWLTWETLERSLDLALDNVERLRGGRPLAGLVP